MSCLIVSFVRRHMKVALWQTYNSTSRPSDDERLADQARGCRHHRLSEEHSSDDLVSCGSYWEISDVVMTASIVAKINNRGVLPELDGRLVCALV